MIEKILKAYEEHRRGCSEMDEVVTPMATIDTLVKHIRKLEAEAEIWKERVQMRQELVEQYERDIAELKRELRAALERS